MKVFRCCEKNEIDDITADKKPSFHGMRGRNNHKYLEGKEYIHLFKFAEDAEFFKERNGVRIDLQWTKCENGALVMKEKVHKVFIAEYDVPSLVLQKYKGIGNYKSDRSDDDITIQEYAIPTDEFDFKWFVGFTEKAKLSQLCPLRRIISQVSRIFS
jgi:hypothetical protein